MRCPLFIVGVFAAVALVPTQSLSASLADLPSKGQQDLATCMFNVVAKTNNVSSAKLTVTQDQDLKYHTTISYKYHHHARAVPNPTSDDIEITDFISRQSGELWVGGIVGTGGLNDSDSGMLDITDGWRTKCGLDLLVVTE
jgi:hypothetical protein